MTVKPYIVAIAGASCTGKTALALSLIEQLGIGEALHLALDAYYRDLSHLAEDERARQNFDTPEALDWPMLREQMARLAAGETIEAPVYNFALHIREPIHKRTVPRAYIIIEGLFALHDETLRRCIGTAVFVEAPDAVCLERRIARDAVERGRTRESVAAQFEGAVRPMAEQFIVPTKQWADIVVDGTAPLEELVGAVLAHIDEAYAE